MWSTDEEWQTYKRKVLIQLGLFLFFALMLIISIIRTISTNPGGIPEEKEWDMNSEMDETSDAEGLLGYSEEKKYQ